jgi:DNA-binding LacI/PurR family transcriptional regulator
MNTVDTSPSKARWLAKRMEEDIRARGLRAGEPFLTTTQAGRQLGISKSMAYRAMKILTDTQVLVSHPGRGTFVGPSVAASVTQTRCCHILLTHDLFQSSGHSTHGWLAGLAATLAGHSVQFDFIPQRDSEPHVKQLLNDGLASGTLSAVVLVGCPREVQEQVLLRGVPAIVLGSDYSSTQQLPSVDADQFETGRLAAQYLLKRGHRRIALLMRETWFPGDRRMFEGVGRALDEAKLGHDALMLRNLSVDPTMLSADLRRMLTDENPPTGCVCRTPLFAEAAMQAAEATGVATPEDFELIIAGLDRLNVAAIGLPSVSMRVNVDEQVAIGGRMLQKIFKGEQPEPLHVILPVELVEPVVPEKRLGKSMRQKRGVVRKSK